MSQLPARSGSPDEDAQLVTAIQAGEIQAFRPLVERHLDAIHAFVAMKLPVAHLVDEITHETFVFAFRSISEFTPGTNFRSWLRTIAANKIRSEITRYGREERNRMAYADRCALDQALAAPDSPDSQEVEALQDCLKRIPENLRTLLQLRYHDEHSAEQIADRLGRTLAWVRTTLCRVRQQLRDCIERKLKTQAS